MTTDATKVTKQVCAVAGGRMAFHKNNSGDGLCVCPYGQVLSRPNANTLYRCTKVSDLTAAPDVESGGFKYADACSSGDVALGLSDTMYQTYRDPICNTDTCPTGSVLVKTGGNNACKKTFADGSSVSIKPQYFLMSSADTNTTVPKKTTEEDKPRRLRPWVWFLIGGIVLLLLGIAMFFIYRSLSRNAPPEAPTPSPLEPPAVQAPVMPSPPVTEVRPSPEDIAPEGEMMPDEFVTKPKAPDMLATPVAPKAPVYGGRKVAKLSKPKAGSKTRK